MTRESIQNEAVKLSLQSSNILLSWCTGCGKSLAFIKSQEALKSQKTLILVAESGHITNWQNEYIKHHKQYLLKSTTIICYASLHKQVNQTYDLICLDEAHRITELRADWLSTIKVSKVIALTATLSLGHLKILEQLWGKFIEYKITLNQAIEAGIITKPLINVVFLSLDKRYKTETIDIKYGKATKIQTIDYKDRWLYLNKVSNTRLIIKCTPWEKYEYFNKLVAFYKSKYHRTFNSFSKIKWLKTGNDRKQYLADLKTPYALKYLKYLQSTNKKFICFCGSIEQANCLGATSVVHSKIPNPQAIVDKFNHDKLRSLFVVNMLQEGTNLEGINSGVIIQLDGQERSFIQRTGRTLRSKETPEVFILVFKDTRDEEYLENALQGINPEYINYIYDVSD